MTRGLVLPIQGDAEMASLIRKASPVAVINFNSPTRSVPTNSPRSCIAEIEMFAPVPKQLVTYRRNRCSLCGGLKLNEIVCLMERSV